MPHPRPPVRSHRDLVVWQRSVELTQATYRLSDDLPERERYVLGDQMRRAAVSIAANIAEGHARRGRRDYLRFLGIATGSLRELESYWDIVSILGLLAPEQLAAPRRIAEEVGKMLSGLRKALLRQPPEPQPPSPKP